RFQGADDWAAFADWMRVYRRRCDINSWIDAPRVIDWVLEKIRAGDIARPPDVFVAGFDELTPHQSEFFDSLEARTEITPPGFAGAVQRFRMRDSTQEITHAARWSRKILENNPRAQIGIVVPNLSQMRAKVERIFWQVLEPGAAGDDTERAFHLSLGP